MLKAALKMRFCEKIRNVTVSLYLRMPDIAGKGESLQAQPLVMLLNVMWKGCRLIKKWKTALITNYARDRMLVYTCIGPRRDGAKTYT